MTQWISWLQSWTPDQKQTLKNIVTLFGINPDDAYNYYNPKLIDFSQYYSNMTSYTARNNLNALIQYLRGTGYYYNQPDQIKNNGKLEYSILSFLADFSTEIKEAITKCFHIIDRSSQDRFDPVRNAPKIQLVYLPKGITDFNPENKVLNEEITARIQREIIKENNKDTSLEDEQDKTITVRVFTNRPEDEEKFLHIYFNKKSPQTLRRIIYKTIREVINFFDLTETIPCQDKDNPIEKTLFLEIVNAFFDTKDTKPTDQLLSEIRTYIDTKLKYQNENLIQIFAETKQKAMNETRKSTLKRNLDVAKECYERNMAEYAQLKNNYLQTKKAYDTFEEIQFTAITVLLTKIKEHPGTKLFAKLNEEYLQFLIEEPLLHTESEVWARILGNNRSEINVFIEDYAYNYAKEYGTTADILRFAIQRLIKELFVDQKIILYTAALLSLSAKESNFQIKKLNLPNNNYLPHPHIGTNSLTCWSEASYQITKRVMENDGETAFLQLIYALQQMTASDNVVSKKLIQLIVNPAYKNSTIYLKKNTENRTTFENLIKEFIKDETDKINAINDSES